jgi:peroxiredoxin
MKPAPALALLLASACAPAVDTVDAGPPSIEPPAECALVDAGAVDWPAQSEWGTTVGSVAHDLTIDDCDGEPVRFADIVAQSELTLFNVGAGWCEPCIEETETLDADIFRRFCGRGLRVVQVLYEDEGSNPITKLECRRWRDSFGLSFPVLSDTLFASGVYFEDALTQTPLNLLVSADGTIVYSSTGVAPADLDERIDALLPAE